MSTWVASGEGTFLEECAAYGRPARFRQRQSNPHNRPLAFRAFYLNRPLVSFDDLLRLKKTYPKTIPFGRSKRLE